MMNSVGIFQAWWLEHQLSDYSASSVGWITATFIAANLGLALNIGPIFDRFGPRWLVVAGSIGYAIAFFLLGSCSKFWHFLLVFGFLGGLSGAVLTIPAIGVLAQSFEETRGLATGLATTGAGAGGVVFPLMGRFMLQKYGWSTATRSIAAVVAFLLIIGNLCLRGKSTARSVNWALDFTCFKDLRFVWATLAYAGTKPILPTSQELTLVTRFD